MSDLVVQKRSKEIVVVELNRPEAYNAFNLEMVTDLTEKLIALATDDSVRGVIVTGRGKSFCAGGDTKNGRCRTRTIPSTSDDGASPAFSG